MNNLYLAHTRLVLIVHTMDVPNINTNCLFGDSSLFDFLWPRGNLQSWQGKISSFHGISDFVYCEIDSLGSTKLAIWYGHSEYSFDKLIVVIYITIVLFVHASVFKTK